MRARQLRRHTVIKAFKPGIRLVLHGVAHRVSIRGAIGGTSIYGQASCLPLDSEDRNLTEGHKERMKVGLQKEYRQERS